jgi:hypothetical protein
MSIGSNCVNQAEFGRDAKFWIFLDETRLEELRKAVAQNFQSCTFNRSVTSPFRNVSTYARRPALQFSMSSKSFLGGPSCNLSERAVRGKDEMAGAT